MAVYNEKDRARIHSFEIWAYRRVSWTEKRSCKSVLEEIEEFKGLDNQIEQQKLQFVGAHNDKQMHR